MEWTHILLWICKNAATLKATNIYPTQDSRYYWYLTASATTVSLCFLILNLLLDFYPGIVQKTFCKENNYSKNLIVLNIPPQYLKMHAYRHAPSLAKTCILKKDLTMTLPAICCCLRSCPLSHDQGKNHIVPNGSKVLP